jgi:hypothetical protein
MSAPLVKMVLLLDVLQWLILLVGTLTYLAGNLVL